MFVFETINERSDFTTDDATTAGPIFGPQLDLHSGLPGIGHHRVRHLCYLAVVMWSADNVAHGFSADLGSVLGVIAIPFPFRARSFRLIPGQIASWWWVTRIKYVNVPGRIRYGTTFRAKRTYP